MRQHLNEHCARCEAIPQEFMDAQRLGQCQVCSRLLSQRFGNECPGCRPRLSVPSDNAHASRPRKAGAPCLQTIVDKRVPTKSYVPSGARALWTQCLILALSEETSIQYYNYEDLEWSSSSSNSSSNNSNSTIDSNIYIENNTDNNNSSSSDENTSMSI